MEPAAIPRSKKLKTPRNINSKLGNKSSVNKYLNVFQSDILGKDNGWIGRPVKRTPAHPYRILLLTCLRKRIEKCRPEFVVNNCVRTKDSARSSLVSEGCIQSRIVVPTDVSGKSNRCRNSSHCSQICRTEQNIRKK